METKLCRICGKISEEYIHIFKTEGLKNKIETCLPIIVSRFSLLPDTICTICVENVDNFYEFIKNSLQSIIILEAQYDIHESSLKSKRKQDKGCHVDFSSEPKEEKSIQTEEDLNDMFFLMERSRSFAQKISDMEKLYSSDQIDSSALPKKNKISLVNYEVDSDDQSECDDRSKNDGRVHLHCNEFLDTVDTNLRYSDVMEPSSFNNIINSTGHQDFPRKTYFDDIENNLIKEIEMRKGLKRKPETILCQRSKICKIDSSNRRKSRQPIKLDVRESEDIEIPEYRHNPSVGSAINCRSTDSNIAMENNEGNMETDAINYLPQSCLLCDTKLGSPSLLAAHVYETHGIDLEQIIANEKSAEKKKKIPNLVKITDLKTKMDSTDIPNMDHQISSTGEELPQLIEQPTSTCVFCPAIFSNRTDLFTHLRIKHEQQSSLLCGLCFSSLPSHVLLTNHLDECKQTYSIDEKFICKICGYSDDNVKTVENHVLVHNFILASCKKQAKMFDPCNYIDINPEGPVKTYTCTKCNENTFTSFKEFSAHRRSEHQMFHCDLCNKSYGRNSHLWKHVNRLHKGHPSITCQLCYKTSASKYHLAQHFNKIHSSRPVKSNVSLQKLDNIKSEDENFLSQKFQGFDFQSVKQSFLKQELLEQQEKNNQSNGNCNSGPHSDCEDNSNSDDNSVDKCDIPSADVVNSNCGSQQPEAADELTTNSMEDTLDENATLPKELDASSNLYNNIITNYTPPQNEGEYKCPKCFKGFHKKPLLKKHKKNCRPKLQKDLLTRCKTCSRIFKDRQSLTKHLINYHSEYTCEICGQKVQSKCEIVSHIRFSHPKCHLFCHCNNILRSQSDLNEHNLDHRNSFVCQFCADMLPTKIKLKMHILSLHRKILSLSCGICLKLFENQHILKDHVRLVHKNELKPLSSCLVCGKNYGSKWKAYDHLNKSHGRIFKACKLCLEVFDSEDALQTHCDQAHANAQLNKSVLNQSNLNASHPNQSRKDSGYDNCKKDLSDSEYEDNSDKNLSSDTSNDNEAFRQFAGSNTSPALSFSGVNNNEEANAQNMCDKVTKQNQNKSVTNSISNINGRENLVVNKVPQGDFISSLGSDNKISLLEKRLLGKSIGDETDLNQLQASEQKESNHQENANKKASNQTKSKSNNLNQSKKSKTDKKNKTFDGDDTILHSSSKRTVYVNSNDPSLCEICNRTWPAKKHLWQHYIRRHKTVAATVCGICLKTNESYDALQNHLRANHPTLLHGQGFGSNFICRICGRYHNASSKLRLHMAIHENFDWNILDNYKNPTTESSTDGKILKQVMTNGHSEENDDEYDEGDVKLQNQTDLENTDSINYESMIEQVECSSEDESEANNESDGDENEITYDNNEKEDYSEDDENAEDIEENPDNSATSDESDNESTFSEEHSIESRMLKNMLSEKKQFLHIGVKEDNHQEELDYYKEIKEELTSSENEDNEEDESSETSPSYSELEANIKNENCSSDEDETSQPAVTSASATGYIIYGCKSEELDTAVRSISCNNIEIHKDQVDEVYCDLQPQNLNPLEIQTAVDSIL